MATNALALYSTASPNASSTELTRTSPCASGPMRHRVRRLLPVSAREGVSNASSRSALPAVTTTLLPSMPRRAPCRGRLPFIALTRRDEPFELTAPLFIVLEHVVARTRRRQQDDVTRRRQPPCCSEDLREGRAEPLHGNDRAKVALNDRRRLAICEDHFHGAPDLVRERRVRLPFVPSAEEEHGRPIHAAQSNLGGGDISRL